jgi:hypothetical protein
VPVAARSSEIEVLRNLDMLALLVALPIFLAVGAPMAGYLAAGGAWVIGRIAMELADRRRKQALGAGNRNAALGVTAAATMGRVWLLAAAILVVARLDAGAAGLAAAVLAFVLVTFNLGATFADHLLHPDAEGSLR